MDGVQVLIPMHDAALFQYPPGFDPKSVVSLFEDTMTASLDGRINGKASIEEFYITHEK